MGTSIFAYEAEIGCEHIVKSLQLIYNKGVEWSNIEPVYIFAIDNSNAFDSVCLQTLVTSLRYWCTPADLIEAIAREMHGLRGTAVLTGLLRPEFVF